MFKVDINRSKTPGYLEPPGPVVKIYRGNYSNIDDTPKSIDMIYDSTLPEDPEHPWVMYLPGEDSYAVRFDRSAGLQYVISLSATDLYGIATGRVKTTCPFNYSAYRYVPTL